jgi:hypothetical protein
MLSGDVNAFAPGLRMDQAIAREAPQVLPLATTFLKCLIVCRNAVSAYPALFSRLHFNDQSP